MGGSGGTTFPQMLAGASCLAPPAVRSASVAFPSCTFFTSFVFAGSICHTLASYVSMQTFPTFTESGGHLSVPAPAGTATARQTAVQPPTMYLRNSLIVSPCCSPPPHRFPGVRPLSGRRLCRRNPPRAHREERPAPRSPAYSRAVQTD